jgi:hypothetical protein
MRFVYMVLAGVACGWGALTIGKGDELLGVAYLCLGFTFIGLSRLAAIAGTVTVIFKGQLERRRREP